MAKKKISEEEIAVMKLEVNKAILNEIGISINKQNYLIDQDYSTIILLAGKPIKYDFNNPESLYIGEEEVLFDPFSNIKMLDYLFGFYTGKQEEYEGWEIRSIYSSEERKTHKSMQGLLYINSSKEQKRYESGLYFNRCLGYIDIILQIAGMDGNMEIFDSEKKQK